jgi:hypothetical protein
MFSQCQILIFLFSVICGEQDAVLFSVSLQQRLRILFFAPVIAWHDFLLWNLRCFAILGEITRAKRNEWNGQKDDVVAPNENERSKGPQNITRNFTLDWHPRLSALDMFASPNW